MRVKAVVWNTDYGHPVRKSPSLHGRSILSLPHRPKISDFFDLCHHWVSVTRGLEPICKKTRENSTHISPFDIFQTTQPSKTFYGSFAMKNSFVSKPLSGTYCPMSAKVRGCQLDIAGPQKFLNFTNLTCQLIDN